MERSVNGCQPPLSPSDKQVFEHLKCEVLESSRHMLTKSLIPDRHMDFLRSKYILSEEDCEEINHLPSRQRRASKFLDILEKKGAEAYDALCSALKEEGTQTFLLRHIHEDFELRQLRYRELVGQQRAAQCFLPVSPPPLLPPSPPSHRQHHQGHDLKPTEHSDPDYLPHPPSYADICPGYESATTNTISCAGDTSTLTNESCIASASSVDEGEGTKEVDLQKQRLNVAEYLQNLNIRPDESSSTAAPASPAGAEFSDLPPDSSLDRQLPTFLSSAATWGSSTDRPSDPSLDQAASSSSMLPVSVQDTQASGGHVPVRHRQYQRLSSRGSLQEMNISVSSPGAGNSANLPSFPGAVMGSLEPVENEDTSETSSLQDPSFFHSLENKSLSPSSSGAVSSNPPILSHIAVNDQRQALDKCVYSCGDPSKDGEENTNDLKQVHETVCPKTTLVNSSELASQLSCLSETRITNKKTVVESSSSSGSCVEKERSSSSTVDADVKGEEGDQGKEEGFVFEEGLSRETRTSVCDKSGHSLHSTHC